MAKFEPWDPDFEAKVRSSFAKQTAMRTLGAVIGKVGPGEVEIEWYGDPDHRSYRVGFAKLEALGFRIAAYPHSLILTCIRSIQRTLAEIKEKGTTKGVLDTMADFNELDELIGFPEAREWEARYTPKDG